MENKVRIYQIFQEALWWVITAAVCYAVIFPIQQKINFYYWFENVFFVVAGITSIRYFLFFNSLFFLQNAWVRFLFFTLNFVLWVYALNRYEMMLQMHDFYDITFFGSMKKALSNKEQTQLLAFIYKEILLVGFVALLGIALLNLRFVGSYWRVAKIRFTNRMQA